MAVTSSAHCSDEKPHDGDGVLNEYEKSRQERIRANLEHFQKLGINSLTLELSSVANAVSVKRSSVTNLPHRKISPKPKHPRSFASPDQPIRRSPRLQNGTPGIYEERVLERYSLNDNDDEDRVPKRRRVLGASSRRVRPGPSGPELYTEEHEKLLGSTDKIWELCVDGCGADGRRIYDSINGKTCHQCRQKTLGHRTFCSSCQSLRGQFCGDCLYMRYGEHVLEANENPDWVCPVCREICNCSFCRTDRGWAPTGNMYRKVVNMGYKSVAHYLIQTNRAPTSTSAADSRYTAKRSLDFKAVTDGGDKSEGEEEGGIGAGEGEKSKVKTERNDEKDKSEAEVEGGIGAGEVEQPAEVKCAEKNCSPVKAKKAVKKEPRVIVQDCIARRLRSRNGST